MAIIHYVIPDDLHRRVKAAAALAGVTQKELLLAALRAVVREPETVLRLAELEEPPASA